MSVVWKSALVGVLSTLSMDVLSVMAIRLRLIAPLPPNLVGRWFALIARAQPVHADIARAAPIGHELAIVFPVHYAIGTALAAMYVWTTAQVGWPTQNVALALAFGFATSLLPWLLMFPAMGYGFFGGHGPAGTRLFVSSLATHAFFGLGLALAVRLVRA